MSPTDALIHLVNFLLPAVGLGAVAAALAKLAWRRELRGVRWWRLAAWAVAADVLVLTAGLIVFGHDGKMATYAGMVLATSLALLWSGFGPGRR